MSLRVEVCTTGVVCVEMFVPVAFENLLWNWTYLICMLKKFSVSVAVPRVAKFERSHVAWMEKREIFLLLPKTGTFHRGHWWLNPTTWILDASHAYLEKASWYFITILDSINKSKSLTLWALSRLFHEEIAHQQFTVTLIFIDCHTLCFLWCIRLKLKSSYENIKKNFNVNNINFA